MQYYNNWQEEIRSAYIYQIMADHEQDIRHKKLFLDLKKAAEKQAQSWELKIKEQGGSAPVYKPDLRTRIIATLIRVLGAERIHSMLSAFKIRGMSVFTHYHTEHKHTSLSSASNLRAAVFGVNDGLISNVSLILGIAGAQGNQHFIVVAGIAGLLAGACSMGAGEYISVRSQKEVFEYQIAIEKEELAEYPEEEMEELKLIYEARGVPPEEAGKLAAIMISNPETGLNALAREELGLNPEDLVSPVGAMISSFLSFGFGAMVPLLPFLLGDSSWNLYYSIALTGVTLFTFGALMSLYTNRNTLLSGLRMLLVGVCAGALTFFIGKLFDVSV